ncbi:flavin reductase [Pseudomonas sp. PIC25]|uniref:flavin reductase family protein n=1 Tax=Pseudomonas sp. PIC25 TaxID=1958773 RepID=UPI000BAB6552|nr:flavin reductase family protein [Pseudomonas sp. PIC25]PAU65286.1 flavin reductase [Pseudomonas sp. PIC25]
MLIDFTRLTPLEAYRWLTATVTPRPIAWVSSLSREGVSNLAPFSFFQVISDEPPTLMVNIGLHDDGRLKDTLRNVQDTGELVIQLVTAKQAEAMNASSASLPHGVSEFEACGIASLPAERVAPPRVAGAPVAFECSLAEVQPYPRDNPSNYLIFARILLAHIDPEILDERGRVDPRKLDLIGRLGGSGYTHTREVFEMPRPVV